MGTAQVLWFCKQLAAVIGLFKSHLTDDSTQENRVSTKMHSCHIYHANVATSPRVSSGSCEIAWIHSLIEWLRPDETLVSFASVYTCVGSFISQLFRFLRCCCL